MISKLPQKRKFIKNFINHVPNLCSWPKSSKDKTSVMFLNFFLNAMIRKIKIHNIFSTIEISKSMKLNKCMQKKNLWKCSFKCFLWWVQENQGVTFLVVPPKDKIAPLFDDFALHYASCILMGFTTFVVSYLNCSIHLGL